MTESDALFQAARQCLDCADIERKCALAASLPQIALDRPSRLRGNDENASSDTLGCAAHLTPGRPLRPHLVAPRALAQRGLGSDIGRAAFLHAIAHIEFNAINLACDAVWRFRGLPDAFYADWAHVAADEARHFALLQARLRELGHAYGDFDAHNGLWEMAEKTAASCLARMALVPRVLEARGLDVTPAMIAKLRHLGDARSAEILEVILREEVAHVAAGSRWFLWCCAREGREPLSTFVALLRKHAGGALRRPFNHAARREAGFDADELDALEALAGAA